MTYEIFKMTLLNELKGYFPPGTSISVNEIRKNNNIVSDCLTILESGSNIAPAIYIQNYYEEFRRDASMDTILAKILHFYSNYWPTENFDPFFDLDIIRDRIVYKLVNFRMNQKILEDIPHIPYMDLAIVFYCLFTSGHPGNETMLIHNNHLGSWNIGKEKLLSLAKKNTPFLLPPQCDGLSKVLTQLFPVDLGATSEKNDQEIYIPMYVLSNGTRMNGAACILYDGLLLNLANSLESDLYILPSSIHETIIVPKFPGMPIECFSNMVREVNLTQLSNDEILSDHAYYFSRKDNKIMDSYPA